MTTEPKDEDLATRRRIAEAMMMAGSSGAPIGSSWQGVNRLAQGLLGGYDLGQIQLEEKQQREAANQALLGLLGPQTSSNAPATPPAQPGGVVSQAPAEGLGDLDKYAEAISKKESGGNYKLVGPDVKRKGGRVDNAYGKYQVMGDNVGPWTKEVLGVEMTPQQFLANPDAQDAVFRAKFGQSVLKYGNPQDAASVWFSGRPMSKAGGARDVLGTTMEGYVSDFNRNLGQPTAATGAPSTAAAAGGGKNLNIPDDMRVKIGALLNNPRTRPFGEALLQKFITADNKPLELEQRARAGGLQPGTPEYQQFMLRGGVEQPMDLERRAKAAGLQPGTPEYQQFMRQGGDAKPLDLERRAEAAGLTPGTPEYKAFMLNNGKAAGGEEIKTSDLGARAKAAGLTPGTPEYKAFMERGGEVKQLDLETRAQAGGLRPGTPEYQEYILKGGEKPLTTTDKTAILGAEEKLAGNRQVIGILDKALSMNKDAMSGPLVGGRSYLLSLAGDKQAIATRDLENMIQTQAIEKLKATFGGMPTEGERKILLELQGSMSENPETRKRIWERAREMAQARLELNQREVDQIRGGTFFKPGGGQSGSASQLKELPQKAAPEPGTVEGGYRFKGGDPSKPENWERVH